MGLFVYVNFVVLLEDFCYWEKYMIYTKIMQLQVNYKICNQLDIGLKATNAKLLRKWSEVTKCIGVQDSQLI